MSFDSSLISQAVARYHRERDRYVKLADRVAEICRDDVCEQNAIRAQVTSRIKTERSFEGKLKRFNQSDRKKYSEVEEIFKDISDLAGVRIAAYRLEDCERIVEHLRREFEGPTGEIEIDRKDKKTPENDNYYRAIHIQVSLPERHLFGTYDNVGDISCEIQICTMIAHVWNEIEHDIGYKPELGGPSDDEKFYLSQLGRLIRQGDLEISSLLAANDRRVSTKPGEMHQDNRKQDFIDVHDFVSRMRDFGDGAMPNFAENSGQLFDLLSDLHISNPFALQTILNNIDLDTVKKEIENFNLHLTDRRIEGLRLDATSSDVLLIALMDCKLQDIMSELKGRAGRGRGRPSRLHRLAVHYQNMKQ